MRPLPRDLEPDTVRVGLERDLLRRLRREHVGWAPSPADYAHVRRECFWTSEPLPVLERARADALAKVARSTLGLHPEAAVRIHAIELFSRTDAYQRLTGQGPGSRLEDVDLRLARLVRPDESADDMGLPPEGQPCLLDRASDALSVARGAAKTALEDALESLHRARTNVEVADVEGLDVYELDMDPLEERFRALERESLAMDRNRS